MYYAPATQTQATQDSWASQEAQCVLYWCLSKRTINLIDNTQLGNLHSELKQCAELVGAKPLEVGATHGMLKCSKMSAVSSADTAVRLGQLLCRWATVQEPELGLGVGVAMGAMQSVTIPGSAEPGYWGTAVTAAKELAESPPRETCVHMRTDARNSLQFFERLPFAVSEDNSYFLEPWVEALDTDGDLQNSPMWSPDRTTTKESLLRDHEAESRLAKIGEMSVDNFAEFLSSMGLDVSKFGRGQAKSLDDLHKDIARKKKSYLRLAGNKLERRLELVRINLSCQGPDGTDRCLKIGMEVLDDGRARTRNQKIACTVTQGQTWKEAVLESLRDRFDLAQEVLDKHLVMEGNWYKEERVYSPSVPGMKTVYQTHEVRMRISKPDAPELLNIGLPSMKNFSTSADGKTSHWCWKGPDEALSHADMLTQLLQEHHISIADFEYAAFQDLVEEVYETKMSTLTVTNDELLRHLEIVKVWIQADVLSVPHVLVTKSKLQYGQRTTRKDRPISMRMSSGQQWEEAVKLAVTQRLGLDFSIQQECLVLERNSYKLTEEVEYSRSYPGLKSVYRIHQVIIIATVPEKLYTMGLPDGTDFVFTRQPSESSRNQEDRIVTQYGWMPVHDCDAFTLGTMGSTSSARMGMDKKKTERPRAYHRTFADSAMDIQISVSAEPDPKRRVDAPAPISVPARSTWKSSYAVAEIMRGKKADLERARRAAKRIRDQDYTLGEFLEDCKAAFPELQLYQVDSLTSSGRSGDDEYQRTIGALFAVFWLMRTHVDGGGCFAYGVDSNWKALSGSSAKPVRKEAELKSRELFLELADWPLFEELFVSAGMLSGPKGQRVHDEGRVLAMLVLTAIHDIMKVEDLLPTVDPKVGSFCGYKAGETISDHDTALGYILEHVPDALPSYAGLPKSQQDPVKFTQCNMEYNMGWLVQAEAPPGPLFRKFRQIIRSGSAKPTDISFYFVHWLTDLAGAEPYPLEGCEKFVLKFPQRVLTSFLKSFQYVQKLSSQTECQVFEDYMKWRWQDQSPKVEVPTGKGAMAQLRLTVMAQGSQDEVLEGYRNLPEAMKEILDVEMARTGCQGTGYVTDPQQRGGPVFLVYYAPALVQKHGSTNAYGALMVLAEVLKQARILFPLEEKDEAETTSVIVRIDSIKDADLHTLVNLQTGFWCLQRVNAKEATVKKLSLLGKDGLWTTMDKNVNRILAFTISPPARGQTVVSNNVQLYDHLDDISEKNGLSPLKEVSSTRVVFDPHEDDMVAPAAATGCCLFRSASRRKAAQH